MKLITLEKCRTMAIHVKALTLLLPSEEGSHDKAWLSTNNLIVCTICGGHFSATCFVNIHVKISEISCTQEYSILCSSLFQNEK